MTAPWYLDHYGATAKANAGDMRAVLAVVAGKTVAGMAGIWASVPGCFSTGRAFLHLLLACDLRVRLDLICLLAIRVATSRVDGALIGATRDELLACHGIFLEVSPMNPAGAPGVACVLPGPSADGAGQRLAGRGCGALCGAGAVQGATDAVRAAGRGWHPSVGAGLPRLVAGSAADLICKLN
jgi:hypothetical protein